jgi:hypothetical protein
MNFGADRPWNEAAHPPQSFRRSAKHALWKCQLFQNLSKLALRYIFYVVTVWSMWSFCVRDFVVQTNGIRGIFRRNWFKDSLIRSLKCRLITLRYRSNGIWDDQNQWKPKINRDWPTFRDVLQVVFFNLLWATLQGGLWDAAHQGWLTSSAKLPGSSIFISVSSNTDHLSSTNSDTKISKDR